MRLWSNIGLTLVGFLFKITSALIEGNFLSFNSTCRLDVFLVTLYYF